MTQPNPFGNTGPQAALQTQQPQQPVDEFELMRRRLRQRGAVTGQERQRELTRQFAALGNLPSGAAFDIRQQAAEAQQRGVSEALQDVNILQAQTQRAEREAEAQRALQRELTGAELGSRRELLGTQLGAQRGLAELEIGAQRELAQLQLGGQRELAQLQLGGQRELAQLQTQSAREIANIQGQFGAEAQERSIASARENLQAEIANRTNLANIDASTKQHLAQLDFDARMQELNVQDTTARYLSDMSLKNQLTIATMDNVLKERNLDLQELMVTANVGATQLESKLNTYATWINSIPPLKEAGYSDGAIQSIKEVLGVDFNLPELDEFEAQRFDVIELQAQIEILRAQRDNPFLGPTSGPL
jgi:hypothetical protein